MGITKNIGKNTIGDNDKMKVHLHDYNLSTHDLSFVHRNTQSVGTLVPSAVLLAQKGDTWYIDIDTHVLTHPTVGPLFGSFKMETHVYSVPIRLYNSWLHNNRLAIGLDMSKIKLPKLQQIVTARDIPYYNDANGGNLGEWSQINPSCLLAYLGLRGWGWTNSGTPMNMNAIPILGYYDIFKNFYANTQEDNFYVIAGVPQVTQVKVQTTGQTDIITNNITSINAIIQNGKTKITILPNTTYEEKELVLTIQRPNDQWSRRQYLAAEIGTWTKSTGILVIEDQLPSNEEYLLVSVEANSTTKLVPYKLSLIDDMRDSLYSQKGNISVNINGSINGVYNKLYGQLVERDSINLMKTRMPQFGLAVKTYNSDLFQNWINTEWVDGINGINEISAVDVKDGSLSIDALNLAQKVYNMLNRIAVSGGTYKDWLETVYTGGHYMERCETPMFEGGVSQEIVFQEVISNSATQEEPLGTLAGRGVSHGKTRGSQIKIKVTEPAFIMAISVITPRIDYSQGNEFWVTHDNMGNLHVPALDGIGYQDSVNWQRAWWDYKKTSAATYQPAAGKTVAWINYMTNVNKTYGNFANNMTEAFMVLNRNYQYNTAAKFDAKTNITDLTTYIDPVKFNYIFADTSLDAMNFWVQTAFDIKVRRLISAKQIPNL